MSKVDLPQLVFPDSEERLLNTTTTTTEMQQACLSEDNEHLRIPTEERLPAPAFSRAHIVVTARNEFTRRRRQPNKSTADLSAALSVLAERCAFDCYTPEQTVVTQ